MLEILNIRAVGKGVLLATCDVHIVPWQMTLHDVKIFEKGASRWIGMPAKEFTNESGEKKYTDLVTFDSDAVKIRFRAQVMGAIDKFLASNPDMTPEDLVKEGQEFPF